MNLISPLGPITVTETAPASAMSPEALLMQGRRNNAEHKIRTTESAIKELPIHKHVANYIAMGISQKDAAKECGLCPATVGNLLRIPWFQERVAEFMKEGTRDVMALFKGAAMGAVVTLIEIADNPKTPPAVRLNALKEILERNMGKTTQTIEVKASTSSDPVAEVAALEEEVARLRV